MRFSFDELYAAETPETALDEDEYSLIGSGDEGIPQLRLPRRKNVVTTTKAVDEDLLDPDLEQLFARLDLTAKLPGARVLKSIPWNKTMRAEECAEKQFELSAQEKPSRRRTAEVSREFSLLHTTVANSIMNKLEALQNENGHQVQRVKEEKLRLREEKRRQEEELRRQEEERRKQEEDKRRQLEEQARRQREGEEERRIKAEQEEKKAREERERLEQEKKKQEALEAARRAQEEAAKGNGITNHHQIERSFNHYKHKIKHIKTDVVEAVKRDSNLKAILSKHKRRINPKFGQLTNSEQHLGSIVAELTSLVDQAKPNALGYQWILNFLAKALVSQAETEVRVKPESALPLAKLALHLLTRYDELLELLMARFVKKCPFVIGYTCKIDSEEGRYKMGWKRGQDNTWEDETSYDERMGGIATLYATITRLPLPQEFITSHKHPLPLSNSWKLLARLANSPTDLLTNTHFVVLGSWWDAAAAQLLQAYGRQAHKLLVLLSQNLTQSVAERKYVGAARLRILFEEYETSGTIKSFPEMTA
ncbi:LADA_0D06524g1_1 [Lachancea dasiensis]|uniref:mRNA export factor GLE1 n=1 Tax=Lachancea dasiensis TaxID=1072105 RepID=A0A1G4J618_9SACH|nr:LADA_0D06524g1_1 [Lachancea dasiensis]